MKRKTLFKNGIHLRKAKYNTENYKSNKKTAVLTVQVKKAWI